MRALYMAVLGAMAIGCTEIPESSGWSAQAATDNAQNCPDRDTKLTPIKTGEPAPATGSAVATAAGYFHTDGARIVDSAGKTVRLTGINWFGLETANFAPHGLWARSLNDMLDQVKSLGFNVLRVPFTNALFDASSKPNGIDESMNPELKGLSGLEVMDKLIAGAKARGLRVILDRHRPDASGQSALWYTAGVSEQKWIDDWTMLAKRYAGEPTVIGADLHNEPHGTATWGTGDNATDWRLAAERAGNAVLAANPNWLIIVEGVEAVASDFYWWGGNLSAASTSPVRLAVANRLVYSPHDYPPSVYAQPWFSQPGYPANLSGVWDTHWGNLAKTAAAPVLVGEFGTRLATTADKQWLGALVDYIKTNGLSFTFWCLNPDSGDTGGILKDDWRTVNTELMDALKPALAPAL